MCDAGWKSWLAVGLVSTAGAFVDARAAAPQRTFVSVLGSDANPCSIALPCRTFTQAVAVAQAGGEVVAVDSGGFGTVTIDKAIQVIVPPGVHAAIFATAGTAVAINAGGSDVVVLRGLYLSTTAATTGIAVASVGRLRLENVTINGFVDGLSSTVGGTLTIRDSSFRNNSGWGVRVLPSLATPATVSIERSAFEGNGYGISVYGSQPSVSIRESSFVGHAQAAVTLYPSVLPQTGSMFVDGCTIVDNNFGVIATANAGAGNVTSIYVSNSTIARNATGVYENPGSGAVATIFSRKDNTLEQNTAGNAFSTIYSAR